MMIRPYPVLTIQSNGEPRKIRVLTEDGYDLTPYCSRVTWFQEPGKPARATIEFVAAKVIPLPEES